MYLSSNNISELPHDFFKFFPSIQWLDLRKNEMTCIFKESNSVKRSSLQSAACIGESQEKNFLIEVCTKMIIILLTRLMESFITKCSYNLINPFV